LIAGFIKFAFGAGEGGNQMIITWLPSALDPTVIETFYLPTEYNGKDTECQLQMPAPGSGSTGFYGGALNDDTMIESLKK
jgi:hypothetical protein